MTEATVIPTKPNKSNQIRELLAQGVTPSIIAKDMGVLIQYVHSVRRRDIEKAKKLKAQAKQTTKRKYTKSGKYAKKAASPLDVPPVVAPAPEVRTQYIEVEVPQPHYNLTWKQRFVALFFGRV